MMFVWMNYRTCLDGNETLCMWLLDHGANPTLRDAQQQTAYNLCKTKGLRDSMRRWATDHEDKWNWTAAAIPLIAADAEQKAAEKKKEKRKKQVYTISYHHDIYVITH